MTYMYALIVLISLVVVMGLFYGLILLLISKKKSYTKKDIILKYFHNAQRKNHKSTPCASCGMTCDEFVEAYLAGRANITDCPSIDIFEKDAIEKIVGKKKSVEIDKVAFVFCKGGNRAEKAFEYVGENTCASQKEIFSGCKLCKSGCLGCMDCQKVCPTGAIKKNRFGVAEVDRTKCIACGECVKACPNDLIKLIPLTQEVAVICNVNSNKLGEDVSKICTVGCTNCKECIKACPTGAISSKNGIIEIDESKCIHCYNCIYACPNRTISRLNKDV